MSGGRGVHVTCSATNHVDYFVKIEQSPLEVHANAAETLSDITPNASSTLAAKLSSPSFVARIFDHALEDSISKLGLVHSCSATNHVDYFVKIEQSHPEVHANAAETLSAITRNASSTLAAKLSSPSFVARIFDHALEDSISKLGLVHSLSVCVYLLVQCSPSLVSVS